MIRVLETDRLVLRAPEARDAEAYIAFLLSDRARYAGGTDSRPRAWRAFAAEIGHWYVRGYGMWTVTLKGDDTGLGLVGLWYPEGWPEREIGWILWPGAEGRGIAHEAALAARAHAYDTLGWTTAVSYIHPENARSIRLADRLGARVDPDAPRTDEIDLIYRHPAPEARA